MTLTVRKRALSASKHLAWVLAAVSAAGCVSDGSSATNSASATSSTAAAAAQSTSSTSSASATTSSTTSTTSSPPTSTSSTLPTQVATQSASSGHGVGTSLIFSYPNGFANASNAIQSAAAAVLSDTVAALSSSAYGEHQAGAIWYKTPQNIQSFTTDFTFQIGASGSGITFSVQNSNSTTNPLAFGDMASADANMLGYGAYDLPQQWPIRNSVAIKFDLTDANGQAYLGATPNSVGLYINGGPDGETGFLPENDLNPSGVNLHSGDIMDAHVVYDGSVLTMTLLDTNTNAQVRMSWPVNIPAVTGSDYAYVGFTAGTIPVVSQNILSWSYWQGYNQELSAPTFSVPAGQYSSSQTVTISGPAGATIYYTTNGQAPTTSSAQYTGPITVSSSTIVQAVAVESGYSDSSVASAYYQMAVNGTPTINFPNGFSGASNLVTTTGSAALSGSNVQLTDTAHNAEAGAAWFDTPVNVQSFTTNFTVNLTGPANANGFTFTIQNQNPASTDTGSTVVSGGPTTVSSAASGLGYEGMNSSVAVVFDLYDGSGSLTGLYYNGANPTASPVDMSSSLNLHSGHPFAVTIAYNGMSLTLTMTDTATDASFSHTWENVDIPTTVGGDTAYVGFTAGTGGLTALQDVSSWTFSN